MSGYASIKLIIVSAYSAVHGINRYADSVEIGNAGVNVGGNGEEVKVGDKVGVGVVEGVNVGSGVLDGVRVKVGGDVEVGMAEDLYSLIASASVAVISIFDVGSCPGSLGVINRKATNNKISNTPIATNQYAIIKTTSFCFLVDSRFGGGCFSIFFIRYPEGKIIP